MAGDLGVWKAEDRALVLIDCQQNMFDVIKSETSTDLVEGGEAARTHARLRV